MQATNPFSVGLQEGLGILKENETYGATEGTEGRWSSYQPAWKYFSIHTIIDTPVEPASYPISKNTIYLQKENAALNSGFSTSNQCLFKNCQG